jgi:hypothetical protein
VLQFFRKVLLGAAVMMVFASHFASAEQIWFTPQAAPANTPLHSADDFIELFQPNAPWQKAASQVTVFKLYSSYLGHAPQAEINVIVADLNRRHIPIALETGVINVNFNPRPACGGLGLVEGYGTVAEAKAISQKVKTAGGIIQYIAMDEPLWYGHYYKAQPGKQPGCQTPLPELINLIAPTLQAYQDEFPNISLGEIEPTGIASQPNWRADITAWATLFRTRLGRPLAFMHLDIPIDRPQDIAAAVDFFHFMETLKQEKDLEAVGIIYNGGPKDQTDQAWVASARSHIQLFEDQNHLRPDQAIIQSWSANPTHAMPDSSPDTLTGLVNYYSQHREQER